MPYISVDECRTFVGLFNRIADDKKNYISDIGKTSLHYVVTNRKNRAFRTQQINTAAKLCLSVLDGFYTETSLKDRVDLLSSLETSLQKYAIRVQNAVTRKWWYRFLYFFGFRAKKPTSIINLHASVKECQPKYKKRLELQEKTEAPLKEFETAERTISAYKTSEELDGYVKNASSQLEKIRDSGWHRYYLSRDSNFADYNETAKKIDALLKSIKQCVTERKKELEKGRIEASLNEIERTFQKIETFDDPAKIDSFISDISGKLLDIKSSIWRASSLSSNDRDEIEKKADRLQGSLEKAADLRLQQIGKRSIDAVKKRARLFTTSLKEIQRKFPRNLVEARRAAHGWLDDPVDVLRKEKMSALGEIMQKLRREPFYQPFGRVAKIAYVKSLSDEIGRVYGFAESISSEIQQCCRYLWLSPRPIDQSIIEFGPSLVEETFNLDSIRGKVKGNAQLQEIIDRIATADQEDNIARIFGVARLPDIERDFHSLKNRVFRITHPDKNPKHIEAATFLQKFVQIAVDRAHAEKYS